MLDKILSFIADKLNWSGFKYTWDVSTNNTSDTWIPVFTGNTIQHRVMPSNGNANATNTKTNIWTGGSINFYRRGNIVLVNGDPKFAKLTTRETVGTIPQGFRPVNTAYAIMNGAKNYLIFNTNGTIQTGDITTAAAQYWFSSAYAVE